MGYQAAYEFCAKGEEEKVDPDRFSLGNKGRKYCPKEKKRIKDVATCKLALDTLKIVKAPDANFIEGKPCFKANGKRNKKGQQTGRHGRLATMVCRKMEPGEEESGDPEEVMTESGEEEYS